jgi:hypothetical protein
MKENPTIEQTAIRITSLEQKLSNGFSVFNGLRRKKILKLEFEQRELIHKFLADTNQEFKDLVEEQYSILSGAKMKFKTYKTRGTATSSYSYSFEGLLRSNGHGYLDVKKSSFALGMMYSSHFEGEISPYGNIAMKSTQVGTSLVNSFPTAFEGEVFEKGYFQLQTKSTDWEVLSEGIALSMIGSVLTDSSKTKRFFSNRDALIRLRDEYKADIEKKTDGKVS